MARKLQWTPEKYRTIVAGKRSEQIEGLRSIMNGFDAADGFNVRDPASWTKSQKAKVRREFHRVSMLQAQPKRMVRARGDNLKKLQDAFHGGIPSKGMKVAFIPDTEPMLTLPGAKKRQPKIRMLKDGIAIERKDFSRILIPFDQRALVKNAKKEIKRAADAMPEASLFYVQVGEHQTLNGRSLGLITQRILDYMQQYDGKKALPESSGNRGDNPKHHHWKYWLNGLVGYVIPKRQAMKTIIQKINKGRAANAELRAERSRYMRRKGEKGRE